MACPEVTQVKSIARGSNKMPAARHFLKRLDMALSLTLTMEMEGDRAGGFAELRTRPLEPKKRQKHRGSLLALSLIAAARA